MISMGALQSRAEPWDLNNIPPEVLILTAGGDVQDDRVEISVLGWTKERASALSSAMPSSGVRMRNHSTWDEVDELLRTKWRHPWGGMLKIDAACIDCGDGEDFTNVKSRASQNFPSRSTACVSPDLLRAGRFSENGPRPAST